MAGTAAAAATAATRLPRRRSFRGGRRFGRGCRTRPGRRGGLRALYAGLGRGWLVLGRVSAGMADFRLFWGNVIGHGSNTFPEEHLPS